ncbi:MAG TPA: GMC family oxidoreductase, partial [Candidatus Dormibacteraeota bacterium]|nr:GMC family oxidoreductase [Candidatus Dormibacteraeota bacterium]
MTRAPGEYDVVVAGAGSAGCVVAWSLVRAGYRVALVEAGPDYGPHDSGRWPEDILDARRLALDSHRWTQTDAADRSQARARVLGGCSSHNACALVRGEPRDYDEWPKGWGAADLGPHLDRAERELRARFFADDEVSPWHRAFVEAAGELVHRHTFNVVGSTRWNAAFAYLDPARGRANLTILADTLVDRVRTGGAVVTSRGELSAGTVVLAAGAYGSPAILLRSGFGPPVGEGLADHVGVGMGWAPTEELLRAAAAHETEHGRLYEPYSLVTPPDLHLAPWSSRA